MSPTFESEDILIGLCWYKAPKIGDVVVVSVQGLDVIKRIASIEGHEIIILGDNPVQSTDSRQFGAINQNAIQARILMRLTSSQKA